MKEQSGWGILFRDGEGGHLLGRYCVPDAKPEDVIAFAPSLVLKTRRVAREAIEKRYGYIRERTDLRSKPHYWRMPKAVRVTVSVGYPVEDA